MLLDGTLKFGLKQMLVTGGIVAAKSVWRFAGPKILEKIYKWILPYFPRLAKYVL